MYQEFALLSARYIASLFRRRRLGPVDRGRTLASLALYGPFSLVGDYVLVLTGHCLALDTLVALGTKRGGK